MFIEKELESLPKGWSLNRVKEISKWQIGFTPDTKNAEYYNGSDDWITIRDMDGKYIEESKNKINGLLFPKYWITPANSLLFSFKLSIGQVAFNKKEVFTNEAICSFSPQSKIDLKYFYYAAPVFIVRNAKKNIYGADLLNQELIANALVFVPPIAQQTTIANYLDIETSKIDRKISILEKKFEKLEEYKQSVIFETVTKGLDKNFQMKDSGIDWIGQIPSHWEVLRLKSIYNYKNGYAFSDSDYSKEPNGNYLIKITNVTESGIQEDETFCIEVNSITKKFKIKENSVLYALSGATAGKCCFLEQSEKNLYLNQRVAQMQLKNGLNKYFYYLICNKVFANLLLNLYPQTAQPNIGKNDLDNSYVPFILNKIEQKEIVNYLDALALKVDKKKEIIKKQIALLKEYKQTIIYEAVTGKIEIN